MRVMSLELCVALKATIWIPAWQKWWQDDMLKARSKHVGILQSGHKRENMIAKYIIRATSPCDYTKCYICSNVGVNELLSMLPLFIFV